MTVHFPRKADRFEFDGEVAEIFDDMAARSLPAYHYVYNLISDWVARNDLPHYSQVWDFGTSTGKGLVAVQRGAKHPYIHYLGCDISEPMIGKASAKCAWAQISQHDLNAGLPPQLEVGNVSVAMFGWTLQFLEDVLLRQRLLKDAFDALAPGGVLFVMEKFRDEGPFASIQQDAYISWRRDNGYSLEEIRAKTVALRGAMYPWRVEDLLTTMSLVDGIESAVTLYRMFSFGGFAFVKAK